MRSFASIAICLAVLYGAIGIRAGQSPGASSKETSCSITGRVTIENEAAPDIAVVLQPATGNWSWPPPVARATTDKEGRFQMSNIPAGRYCLVPLAAVYFAPSEDREVESGKLITLMKGDNVDGIELKLIPGGAITGRVTAAGGYPVIGQEIYAMLADTRGQRPLPVRRDWSGRSRFKTDDRGVYRVYGLPTGRYIVSVQSEVRGQRTETFHPGVTERAQASPIEVTAGKDTENVDIKLAPITNAYEASGRVVYEATGQPIPRIKVNCLGGKNGSYHVGAPEVNEQGEFSFTGLAPGRYAVYVPVSFSEYYSDRLVFEVVDQDVTGLEIKARRAASLSGNVVIEGARDPAILSDLSHLEISLSRRAGGAWVGAKVGADGRFLIPGIPPDKFRLNISSKAERQRFWLLGVERDGVLQPEDIEVADGAQIKGVRVIVAYGAGVVRGQVQVVGGSLPENVRFDVTARRADIPGNPISAPAVVADARGRFLLEGITAGENEIILEPFIQTPNGKMRRANWPQVKQTVSVTGGAESQVTIVFDASRLNSKERKQ